MATEMVERIQQGLAKIDAADKDCPIRRSRRFIEVCPDCGAGTSDGCGKEISASYEFIADMRAMISSEIGGG